MPSVETVNYEEVKPQRRAKLEDALSASTRGKRRSLSCEKMRQI